MKNGNFSIESLEQRALMSVSLTSAAGNSVAYDSSGNLNIAYYDTSAHALKFVTQAAGSQTLGTSMTIDTFNASDLTGNIATTVDPSGHAGVAYYDPQTSSLKYAHFNGTGWDVSTVDSKSNSGLKPSLAYDSKGHALITYFQQGTMDLKYAEQSGKKWNKTTVVKNATDIVSSAVGVNPVTGKKVIVYQSKNGDIRYTQRTSSGWKSQSVSNGPVSAISALTPFLSMDLKSSSNHSTTTATPNLLTSPTGIDSLGQLGTSLSLAFDSNGNALVSYYDSTSGQIKLATQNGKTFSTQSVATVAAGSDPQPVVLNVNGQPTVVYYDSTSDGLYSATSAGNGSFTTTQLSTGGKNATVTLNSNGTIAYSIFDATLGTLGVNQTSTSPNIPTNLLATAISTSEVDLTWTDNSSNESSFRIDRSTDGTNFTTIGSASSNATTYSDTTVSEGTTYYYRIYAIGSDGSANLGTIKSGAGANNAAQATTYPAAATSLTAVATTSTISLSWTDVSNGETGYTVERSTDGGNTYTLLSTLGANTTQFVDSNLTEGTTYYYRVTPFDSTGNGTALINSFTTLPLAPTDLAATVISSSEVDLAWTDNSVSATSYIVERSADGGANFVQVATLAAGSTSYADISAPDNTALIYRVSAVAGSSASDYAVSDQVTTPEAIPAEASDLTVTGTTASSVDLSWTDNSTNETSFVIERSIDGDNFVQVGSVDANVTTFTDTTVDDGTQYEYRVRAVGNGGTSAASNTATATTDLNAPSDLVATAVSPTEVDLTWTDNSNNESQYLVFRDGEIIATLDADTTSYADTSVAEGISYSYEIKANSDIAESAHSAASVAVTPLYAPSDLAATTVSSTEGDLTWNDNSGNETGYEVYRADDGGDFALIATVTDGSNAYADTTAYDGHAYDYQVRAINDVASSEYSNTASVSTDVLAPSDLQASVISGNEIDLSWTDNSNGETGYVIERFDGTNWNQVGQVGANVTTFSDASVDELTDYSYRVYATAPTGDSTPTDSVDATSTLNTPTDLVATAPSPTQIDLTWSDTSNNETQYFVYRDGNLIATLNADSTSYSDNSVTEGVSYSYQVQAATDTVASPLSDASVATTPLNTPTDLATNTVSSTEVDLSWTDNSDNETGYEIYRADDGGDFALIATVTDGSNAYSDTAAFDGHAYDYQVRAVNDISTSDYSNTASVSSAVLAPTDLQATTVSGSEIDLSWTDNSNGETGYVIERFDGTNWNEVGQVDANVTTFSDTTADEVTTYSYRVYATAPTGNSAPTDSADATSGLNAPSDLQATSASPSEIDLTWTDNSNSETQYLVFRDGNLIATLDADSTSYSDTSVTEGASYSYQVQAATDEVQSALSDASVAVTPLNAPTDLTATTVSNTEVDLAWTDNSDNETGYQVYRSEDGGNYSLIATVTDGSNAYADTAAYDGHAYDYQVFAINDVTYSDFNGIASVSTPAVAPTNLQATAASSSEVDLTWEDNSNGETGYVIERSDDGGTTWNPIDNVGVGATSYSDNTVAESTDYSYRVHATAPAGDSDNSNIAEVTTPADSNTPSVFSNELISLS